MKRPGITLIELIMSIAIFALVLTSLVSFLFTISDASRTQTVAHDVLSYHREVTHVMDSLIRGASEVSSSSLFSSTTGKVTLVSGDDTTRSFALTNGAIIFTSSTESISLSSNRIVVDNLFVEPVMNDDGISGVTYSIGVRSSAVDQNYRVDTTSTVLLRVQP
jgi:prepilin-type N-terminal cleavage/methylation domain-containing protein